jgi:hypothetical protein
VDFVAIGPSRRNNELFNAAKKKHNREFPKKYGMLSIEVLNKSAAG